MRTLTTLSRGVAAVGTAGLLSLGFATAAFAAEPPTGNEANQPENWVPYVEAEGYTGVECAKLSTGFDGVSWTTDKDYVLVVLKNATHNDEFWEVPADETIETDVHGEEPQHDISHIIVCTADMEEEPTTPTKPTEPTGPVVETDIVKSNNSTTPAILGGAAALAGLGLAGAVMRRKGQH